MVSIRSLFARKKLRQEVLSIHYYQTSFKLSLQFYQKQHIAIAFILNMALILCSQISKLSCLKLGIKHEILHLKQIGQFPTLLRTASTHNFMANSHKKYLCTYSIYLKHHKYETSLGFNKAKLCRQTNCFSLTDMFINILHTEIGMRQP